MLLPLDSLSVLELVSQASCSGVLEKDNATGVQCLSELWALWGESGPTGGVDDDLRKMSLTL